MFERISSLFIVVMIGLVTSQATASTVAPLMTPSISTTSTTNRLPLLAQQSFAEWRTSLRMEVVQQGISPLLFEQAFAGLTPDPQIGRASCRERV